MRINNQEVVKIGKGAFSTAYRVVDSDVVIIATKTQDDSANDNTKEIYTHIDSKHVPYMATIDTKVYMPKVGHVNLYESRFYMPLSAKSRQAWSDYKALQKAWNHIMSESYAQLNAIQHGEYYRWYEISYNFIQYLEENQIVSAELIRVLGLIHTWSTAFGPNFLLEFSPRNLKVDSEGNLILLDIVFFRKPKNR